MQAMHDFEETRRCMLKVYSSHIQTHTGLLIAIIIGAFTLISRFGDFYLVKNNIITFGLLLSIIVGASTYLLCRIFYWSFCDTAAVMVHYSIIKKICEANLKEIKVEKGENVKEPIPQTYALAFFIKKYLKEPTNFYPDAKLRFYHKIAGLTKLAQIALVVITTLVSFIVFLQINGFLWH
jgi:hypothetical protein